MLSNYAKGEWATIVVIGLLLSLTVTLVGLWWLCIPVLLVTAALVLFFRDPHRRSPSQRGVMVSPADGRISSIHRIEHFEPFSGPALCVRVFLSVFDVHVNRSPCHGIVASKLHKPGEHLNALNPQSADANEAVTIVLLHPIRQHPVAAVRQVAGLLARTIVCAVQPGMVLQRGQRFGIIKFGSTTELYIPEAFQPQVVVTHGQYVKGGLTVVATVGPAAEGEGHAPAHGPASPPHSPG